MAYQYYAYDKRLSREDINAMYKFVAGNFKPDLTIILDINPEIGLARSFKKAEGMATKEIRFENKALQWHEKLRRGYLEIAENETERCVVLNADKTVAKLHDDIVAVIEAKFNL